MGSTVFTKFSVPQVGAGLVFRPRIMARYQEGLRRKLTLVTAPAGYGKTTSAAAWLQSLAQQETAAAAEQVGTETAGGDGSPIKPSWYALDPEDDDYSTFFTRLVTAIETPLPGALAAVARGMDLSAIQPVTYANALGEALLRLPEELVLVLDDYHVITSPQIHSVLAHLIQYASSRLHLVILTRHDPPLGIARLRVQQQVSEVRIDDLRMTDDEAARLLDVRLHRVLPPSGVAVLQARTEGWAAGLQLAAISINEEGAETFLEQFQLSDSGHVLDFLIDEVLGEAPAELREFLLKTSVVRRFNVEVASIVAEADSAACRQILERLRQQNMFLVGLDKERTWFRYHHQFRAMLLNRARAQYPDEVIRTLRRRATEWLKSSGWSEEALAEYVAAGEWEQAADLVEAERHLRQNRQEWHLLWRWLEMLPPEVIARRPELLLAKAWVLHSHDRIAALIPLVEEAAALLGPPAGQEAAPRASGTAAHRTPQEVLWGEISALRAGPFRPDVPLAQRAAWIKEALVRVTPARPYEWVRGYVFIALSHVLLGQGRREEAYRQVLREIEATDLDSGRYLARLHQALGNIVYYDGALSELEKTSARYLELALRYELATAAGFARFGIGWAKYQRGAAAPEVYAALLPIFDGLQVVHLLSSMVALPIMIVVAVEMGKADAAQQLIGQVRRSAVERGNIFALDKVAAAEAYLALLQKEAAPALDWARNFLGTSLEAMAGRADLSQWSVQVFICAKVLLAHGTQAQIEQIIPPLQAFTESAQSRGFVVEVIQGAVLLACCCRRCDQPVKALQWMQCGLELGMARGFRRVFFEQAPDVAKLLHTMVERRVCVEKATLLLGEIAAWPCARQEAGPGARPPTRPQADPYVPLSERETEVLKLLAQKLSNKEIAQRLCISTLTVRNHTSKIYEKLSVDSRKRAVARAQVLHLL